MKSAKLDFRYPRMIFFTNPFSGHLCNMGYYMYLCVPFWEVKHHQSGCKWWQSIFFSDVEGGRMANPVQVSSMASKTLRKGMAPKIWTRCFSWDAGQVLNQNEWMSWAFESFVHTKLVKFSPFLKAACFLNTKLASVLGIPCIFLRVPGGLPIFLLNTCLGFTCVHH